MNSELTEKTDIKEWRSSERPGGLGAAAPRADSFGGWILYDGDCSSCTASARRFDRIFRRRGFLFLPLQTDWVMKRLDLEPGAPLEEMRVLTSNGRDIGGADAVIFLGRQIWWARPFVALARLPGMHNVLDRGYRWIAAHRGCDHIGCSLKERRSLDRRFCKSAAEKPPLLEFWPAWIPLIGFPPLALLARNHVAPWQFMWLMAGAIFLGCKWLTFWSARRQIVHVRVGRALAYLLLWPGLDAEKFLRRLACEVHKTREQAVVSGASEELSGNVPDRAGRMPALPFLSAIGKTLLGVVLLFGVARFLDQALLAGWIGMIGIILILHFGLFHLLAIGWRAAGLDAKPIMKAPLRSKSVSEFWGRRWNDAFNRLALDFVFRPLARRQGIRIATLAAFLVSGLVITAVPAFWLFHPPFVRNVILPFMKAIGAL
ncbi:MAG: hypothetical protein DMF23_02000 [Verrucomicrobia bacterium]|nr:MAG: hypothetical protein DMF23_02000 [Verrucomicrobiota bacterium]